MDDKQFQQLMNALKGINTGLEKLSGQMAALSRAQRSEAPNYQRPLAAYKIFDWSSIGAIVLDSDGDGPTRVEYLGHHFTRRSNGGKFGDAIWFSRPQGKNEDGSNRYARLITFKDYSEAEEIDGRIDLPTPPPPSAPVAPPTPPANPIPAKDWEADARTCKDPFLFDTAVVQAYPWYKNSSNAKSFRTLIFGEVWDSTLASAYLAGLKTYQEKRTEFNKQGMAPKTAHEQARTEALNRFHVTQKQQ